MHWIMRKEFEIAYEKADEVLKKINFNCAERIRTASLIDAVEELLNIDVKFADYDFRKLSKNRGSEFEEYGAAMCVSVEEKERRAIIILNEKETAKMKRFSLVHELGHLMTQKNLTSTGYRVSTHIDMNITSIPDEILDEKENKFLIDEQVANIFALLVLIPESALLEAIDEFDDLDKMADYFGVERIAMLSRIKLFIDKIKEERN